MSGFQTASGSIYYIDSVNKLVCGGALGDNWIPYVSLSAIIGCNATIVLITGQIINTNIVLSYI